MRDGELYARGAADDKGRAFWRRTLEDLDQKKGDFKRAVGLLERSGALTATLDRATCYGAEARAALDHFADSDMRAALAESVEFTVRRAY